MDAAWTHARHRINGVTLHAVEAGPPDGPLVLLLHGFPEFWWGWRRQIGPLADAGLRVVAPDLRGYNLSDKPPGVESYMPDVLAADVLGLMDAYGRTEARVVGHDWGGIIAWWTAAKHPDRVERLAILNAPHPDAWSRRVRRSPGQALRSTYAALFQLPRLPEVLLRAGGFAALRRALSGSARPDAFRPGELDRYVEAWSQPGALTAMLDYYRALWRRPAAPLPRIAPPTLVLWGAHDVALQRALAREGLALCDRGGGVFLERATHWVHLEEPDAVNAALTAFLRG